jgi:hypothetical protein
LIHASRSLVPRRSGPGGSHLGEHLVQTHPDLLGLRDADAVIPRGLIREEVALSWLKAEEIGFAVTH